MRSGKFILKEMPLDLIKGTMEKLLDKGMGRGILYFYKCLLLVKMREYPFCDLYRTG